MKHQNRWLIGLGFFLVPLIGCSSDGGACTDTFVDGANTLYHGTSCASHAPASVVNATPPSGDGCVETLAYGCDDSGANCGDTYRRACPGGVEEKTLELGCRKGPPGGSPAYVYDATAQVTRDAFALNLRFVDPNTGATQTLVNPWGAAIDRFNQLFDDGISPRLAFVERKVAGGQGQGGGNSTFAKLDILSFQVVLKGVLDDFPNAAGVTTCGEDQVNGRARCIEVILLDNIRRFASFTGSPIQDVANVVGLHELGHVACIEHEFVDGDITVLPKFTAMNSFMLTDTQNPASRYFKYDPSELADARQAFADGQALPAPGTVFVHGFNSD